MPREKINIVEGTNAVLPPGVVILIKKGESGRYKQICLDDVPKASRDNILHGAEFVAKSVGTHPRAVSDGAFCMDPNKGLSSQVDYRVCSEKMAERFVVKS